MAKKNQENPLEELEKAYAHWQDLYDYGGQDSFWPDGCNLNSDIRYGFPHGA